MQLNMQISQNKVLAFPLAPFIQWHTQVPAYTHIIGLHIKVLTHSKYMKLATVSKSTIQYNHNQNGDNEHD